MGVRYTAYRVFHELEKRLGVLEKKHPADPKKKKFISLEQWKKNTFFSAMPERTALQLVKYRDENLKIAAQKILAGEICFFSAEWKNLGLDYDWITNPDTGFQYDQEKHWSQINDFNPENGDIKYVWEKSRFTFLLTIIRYDYHFEEDHSDFVFEQIESWIAANKVNQGPNWKCSQETSLRIFNWMYALNFYRNSPNLTEKRWNEIQNVIYWSLHHVYHHIDFSRIAVRNNHAITETLFLTLSEFLFPFIPETKKWSHEGRKRLEQEVAYQVYEDGTFLQFSMNYHRVLVQLFSLGISISEQNGKSFSDTFYQRAYGSLNFLYQCLQEENGFLPNYGANDGAIFFPFSNTIYRDYRSQLNSLHRILTGENLFEAPEFTEEHHWFHPSDHSKGKFKPLQKKYGTISFEDGGYYLCRTDHSFTFIRCGNHKDRPSHADNLHMDVWVKGENILRDSGTYQYNTSKEFSDYFTGTAGHNSVTVDNQSQMLKGSRFIWYFWTQKLTASWTEAADSFNFSGSVSAFRFLNPNAQHLRQVKIAKAKNEWVVKDLIKNLEEYPKKQIWHVDNFKLELGSKMADQPIVSGNEVSYYSEYYGVKENGKAISFIFQNEIETKLSYNN